ncbi:MAG: hypothetical protein IPP74_14665 [Alphaproteobacteria bacterium]|nr:hypothetical protein [Alphaproteobacteria bacterium]
MENLNSVMEQLSEGTEYEVTYYNDNDGRTDDFEDDGNYHVVRNGHRFCFDVVQDREVPLNVQRQLSTLVDTVLSNN